MKISIPARPKQKLGQNFLHDENVLAKIIRFIDPKPGERILEIGGGTGALTAPLAKAAAKLVVVELDSSLVARLQSIPGVIVINEDIQNVSICELEQGAMWRITGNLPYYISTSILTYLLRQRACIIDMVLMFQEEVAQRIMSKPSHSEYSMLSVLCQYYCSIVSGFRISRNSFTPKPEVESRVLRFHIKKETLIDYETYARLLADAFSQRRKKLRNNLLRTRNIDPGKLDALLAAIGINRDARAENLTAKQYEALLLDPAFANVR